MLCGAKAVLCGLQMAVCIDWACALWLQRLFYVASKGDVKAVFWLAVWAVFSSCPDGVCVFLHLQCSDGVCIGLCLHRLGLCSVALRDKDCFMWIPKVT